MKNTKKCAVLNRPWGCARPSAILARLHLVSLALLKNIVNKILSIVPSFFMIYDRFDRKCILNKKNRKNIPFTNSNTAKRLFSSFATFKKSKLGHPTTYFLPDTEKTIWPRNAFVEEVICHKIIHYFCLTYNHMVNLRISMF